MVRILLPWGAGETFVIYGRREPMLTLLICLLFSNKLDSSLGLGLFIDVRFGDGIGSGSLRSFYGG